MKKNKQGHKLQGGSKPIQGKPDRFYKYHEFKSKHAGELLVIAVFLFLLLLISVLKNISYPLFWADESMTAIGTERVLQFGYPKVHDGKNVFYDLRSSNPVLGIQEKSDAYIGGAGWAQYYFGTIGYSLAKNTQNIFSKTGIFRTTFAIAGLCGLFLLGFFISKLLTDRFTKNAFLALFFLLELLSVSMALLLREVRYYSLVMLLISLILGMYCVFRFYKPFHPFIYIPVLSICLWLLFNTFSPVYFIMIIAIGISEAGMLILYGLRKNLMFFVKSSYPVLLALVISLIGIIPLLSYFKTFEIAKAMNEYHSYNSEIYWQNVSTVFNFFKNFDLLWLALLLKIILVVRIRKIYADKTPAFMASCFLTLFFIVFLFTIARIPNFIYTRYIIYLQPVLAIIIILDLITILRQFSIANTKLFSVKTGLTISIFACAVLIMVARNFESISGHLHELAEPYRGPLDYTIPFLIDKYTSPDSLVIAANYEETSYMYYLKSKVIMGFAGNNLREDSITPPDVLAYRKTWGNYASVFNRFIQSAPFEAEKFPIKDTPVNNIPELNFKPAFNHQFRTLKPVDDKDATYLYIRK